MNLIAIILVFLGGVATSFIVQIWVGRIRCRIHSEKISKLLVKSLPIDTLETNKFKGRVNESFKKLQTENLNTGESVKNLIKKISEISVNVLTGINALFDNLQTVSFKASKAAMSLLETTQHEMSVAEMSTDLKNKSQQSANSLSAISFSISNVSNNCEKQKQIAMETRLKVEDSKSAFDNLIGSITSINEITARINSVARKTKLLALNASIEAASAGEAGRGFAIVANEVKELSHESSDATEQISIHIDMVQKSIELTFQGLITILEKIKNIDELAQEIASSIKDQNASVNEIANASAVACQLALSICDTINSSANGLMAITENVAEISSSSNNAINDAEGVKLHFEHVNNIVSLN